MLGGLVGYALAGRTISSPKANASGRTVKAKMRIAIARDWVTGYPAR